MAFNPGGTMTLHDNLEEYRDAEMYDQENGGFEIGGPFFEELGQKAENPILELACGTGRITIPLAERGFEVTGVDLTQEMLERAKLKAEEKQVSIEWHLGDCCNFDLQKQFRLVFMTGNAFQAFLDRESQEKMLQTVHKHLHPEGYFAFETRNPRLADLNSGNGELKEWGSMTNQEGMEIKISERKWYDPINQIESYVTYRQPISKAGSQILDPIETRIDLRYCFPQELESLLHDNGFTVVHQFGNFDKSPFTSESPLIVSVCQKR
jgi:SAM-dependent methyltransferase